ncbi:MAG: phosphoenolpyruvate--protein phosphotransferase [Telmatospirillum sp.]|nr:phosphoenolpyruvate--protein phosphotransferase [Telmatospirillum sp.]
MIGLVLVSHSRALATALSQLVLQMTGPDFPVVVAAGVGDDHQEIGTDAVHIAEVLQPFCEGDGAVVLMDLGSAVLSAQTALELLDAEGITGAADKIRLCAAPIVEAAIAAAVQAKAGASLDAVVSEAKGALAAKAAQLGDDAPAPSAGPDGAAAADEAGLTLDLVIENPHGLHARPAATLVQTAARFQADIRLRNLSNGRGPAPARSMTGIGLLQIRKGDAVRFEVSGTDAGTAVATLRELADARFGEAADGSEPGTPAPVMTPTPVGGTGTPPVAISEGIAIGRPLPLASLEVDLRDGPTATPAEERARLTEALRQASDGIGTSHIGSGAATDILAAQALILSDPAVIEAVETRILRDGQSALAAWRGETQALADAYGAMEDDYLRARAADLRDLSNRVCRILAGVTAPQTLAPEPPAILLVDELLPGDAMAADPRHVLGILARSGSPTAHAAIIARSRGIPMVVSARDWTAAAEAETVALDGATGEVWIDPDDDARLLIAGRQRDHLARLQVFDSTKHLPATTLDGVTIAVFANVGNATDAAAATENGAEGVGLLRTEFVYLGRQSVPTEDEQVAALDAVFAPLGPGPLVVRTPDIGADKPLAFLPQPPEHNPFLGIRGVRLSFRHPDFFASNLRAILRAGTGRDLRIMVPMVTSPDEMEQARALAQAAHRTLEAQGIPHVWPVSLGMMVEVPSAALMVEQFSRSADFFSIGTNDLTQYILAAERGNADLDDLQDPVHPAVLQTIAGICAGARTAGRHVGVCGDAASDPLAAALLIGCGVQSLSARANRVGAIKAMVRRTSAAVLQRLAEEARRCDTAAQVRHLVRESLDARGGVI